MDERNPYTNPPEGNNTGAHNPYGNNTEGQPHAGQSTPPYGSGANAQSPYGHTQYQPYANTQYGQGVRPPRPYNANNPYEGTPYANQQYPGAPFKGQGVPPQGSFNPYYGNMPSFAVGTSPRAALAKKERSVLRFFALVSGVAMFGYLLISSLIGDILYTSSLSSLYQQNSYFSTGVDMLYSLCALGLPFLAAFFIFKKRGYIKSINLSRGTCGRGEGALLVLIGAGGCMAANFATTFFVSFMSSFGVELPYNETETPAEPLAVILMFVKIAIVPALVEEFAVRGVMLPVFRRYGDTFAVVASSAVFALLHANLVQFPFAFSVGLVLGYIACRTNSIWYGVFIHAANNAVSCTESLLYDILSQDKAMAISMIIMVSLLVIGGLALAMYFQRGYNKKPRSVRTVLTSGEKARAFCFQPLFVCAAVVLIGIALTELIRQ